MPGWRPGAGGQALDGDAALHRTPEQAAEAVHAGGDGRGLDGVGAQLAAEQVVAGRGADVGEIGRHLCLQRGRVGVERRGVLERIGTLAKARLRPARHQLGCGHSRASQQACAATSASECPSRPGSPGHSRPASRSGRPEPGAVNRWTSRPTPTRGRGDGRPAGITRPDCAAPYSGPMPRAAVVVLAGGSGTRVGAGSTRCTCRWRAAASSPGHCSRPPRSPRSSPSCSSSGPTTSTSRTRCSAGGRRSRRPDGRRRRDPARIGGRRPGSPCAGGRERADRRDRHPRRRPSAGRRLAVPVGRQTADAVGGAVPVLAAPGVLRIENDGHPASDPRDAPRAARPCSDAAGFPRQGPARGLRGGARARVRGNRHREQRRGVLAGWSYERSRAAR